MEPKELALVVSSCLLFFGALFLIVYWNFGVWDRFSTWLLENFVQQMRAVNLDTSQVPEYLRWWGISMVAVFSLSVILGIPVIGVAIVFFIYIAPRYILEYLVARRRALLRDQMAGASIAMANAARAGLALPQALESISKESPQPLGAEFRRIVQEYERGRPLPDALRDAKERLELDGFTLFTSSLLTCLDRGGKITEALERISKSLQESQRLERKLDADTATGRKVVIILIMFPVVFLLGFYMLDPDATGILFSTIPGQIIVVVVLALAYVSAHWAKKILTVEF